MKTILFLFIVLVNLDGISQQLPFLRSEVYAPQTSNPASYGTWNDFSINLDGQHVQFPNDKIQSVVFTGEYCPTLFKSGLGTGAGVYYLYNHVAFIKQHAVGLPVNGQVKMGKTYLSVGIAPELIFMSVDTNYWTPTTVIDPNIPSFISQTKFSLNAGLMLYQQKWYGGISFNQLNTPYFDELNFNAALHVFMHAGYRFKVSENIQLFPSVKIGFVNPSTRSLNTTILMQFLNPGISFGFGYSSGSILNALLSYDLKNFNFILQAGTNGLLQKSSFYQVYEVRLSYRLQKSFGCESCTNRNAEKKCEHEIVL